MPMFKGKAAMRPPSHTRKWMRTLPSSHRTAAVGTAALVVFSLAACGDGGDRPAGSAAAGSDASARIAELEAAATRYPLKEAFFGETHVHTGVSMDAFIGGNRLTPDGAYRFANRE